MVADANRGAEAAEWIKAAKAMKAAIEADEKKYIDCYGLGEYSECKMSGCHKALLDAAALCPVDESATQVAAARAEIADAQAKLEAAQAKLKEVENA